METIPRNRVFQHNPDTLNALREQYNLNTQQRMDQAIDILDHWIKKQNHFVKKDFSREYLERCIIITKGSLEKAKKKMDKICTLRTLMPDYFQVTDAKDLMKDYNPIIIDAVLPKLTPDHYRVYILRNRGKRFDTGFANYYKYVVMLCEYFQSHDYLSGFSAIFDYRETNMLELLKNINIMELRQTLSIITEGHSFRIKGLHFITDSKMIDTLIGVFKQALSEKITSRIHVHKDTSTLAEHVPIDILPVDYGGQERSLEKLHDDLIEELSSNEFKDYLRDISNARTDEALRQVDKFNEEYLGMPGSFRTLNVD